MERQDLLRTKVASEAADWFAHLQAPDASASDREEFGRWLLLSPLHIEEYLAITRIWSDAQMMTDLSVDELVALARAEPESDNVITLAGGAPPPAPRRRRSVWSLAAAATVAFAILGWQATDLWPDPSRIRTAVGEQRSVTLQDGSVLYVNTNSDVQVEWSARERRVELVSGEARFAVAKDPTRPFLVTTPHATLRALGTVFNVRIGSEQTAVTVIEGRVALARRAPANSAGTATAASAPQAAGVPVVGTPAQGAGDVLELTAGEHAAITQQGSILPNEGPSVESSLAWSERRLVFRDQPLADVVADFNRYHEASLRIDDPGLAAIRISGSFYAGDPQSLVEFLERYERVRITTDAAGDQILTR